MIVVKIELWPSGSESAAREIGRTYIANVGGTARRGDYRAHTCRRGSTATSHEWLAGGAVEPPKSTRTAELDSHLPRAGEVRGYPRIAYNVWRLVIRALLACFPEERS